MVKELVIFPDDRVNIACTDVRKFDEELDELLQDMKDTMEANGLDALSAIQIAYPYNVIILKEEDGDYHEYINPRIIGKEGQFDSLEETVYYPDIKQTIPRYKKIKLIYEDRKGRPQHQDIDEPKRSATFQRKIDYLFGGTFLDKVSKKHRERVLEALKSNGLVPEVEVCPTFSKKDYFVSFTDKILILMGLSLLSPLFDFTKETMAKIYTFDRIALPLVIIMMIGFFFYAQYEAKKYSQCSSCQIGNNIGVMVKRAVAAIVFAAGSYFLVNPN
jgi:peptide deformylase